MPTIDVSELPYLQSFTYLPEKFRVSMVLMEADTGHAERTAYFPFHLKRARNKERIVQFSAPRGLERVIEGQAIIESCELFIELYKTEEGKTQRTNLWVFNQDAETVELCLGIQAYRFMRGVNRGDRYRDKGLIPVKHFSYPRDIAGSTTADHEQMSPEIFNRIAA